MNKKIEIKNNLLVAVDDANNFKVVNPVDNIKEVLSTENNIEEIQDEILDIDKRLHTVKGDKNASRVFSICCLAINAVILGKIILSPYDISHTLIFSGISTYILGFAAAMLKVQSNSYKKEETKLKAEKELFIEALKEEDKNLELLKSKSKMVEPSKMDIKDKTIANSKTIPELHGKAQLIHYYYDMRKKLISYYENGKMNKLLEKGFSDAEIEFISEIARNDIHNTTIEQIEKKKQKKFTK